MSLVFLICFFVTFFSWWRSYITKISLKLYFWVIICSNCCESGGDSSWLLEKACICDVDANTASYKIPTLLHSDESTCWQINPCTFLFSSSVAVSTPCGSFKKTFYTVLWMRIQITPQTQEATWRGILLLLCFYCLLALVCRLQSVEDQSE